MQKSRVSIFFAPFFLMASQTLELQCDIQVLRNTFVEIIAHK